MPTYVSARFWTGFLRMLALQRIDVDDLVGDLHLEGVDGTRRNVLIPWDAVAEIGERLERRLGGGHALEALGASIVTSRPMPALRRLAGWTASPSSLYRFGLRWLALHAPRECASRLEVLADGRLELHLVMPEGARSSGPLLRLLTGAARALPSLLDLPDAIVDARIGPHSARLRITPPGRGSLRSRMRRGLITLFGSQRAIEQLEHEQHLLRRHVDLLEHALAETTEREASLRKLVAASSELLLEVGEDGRIRAASDSAVQVTGYSPHQIAGSHLSLWFHREDAEDVRAFVSHVMGGDDTLVVDGLRARHERGDWLRVRLEARRCATAHGTREIVIAMCESLRGREAGQDADLETRLHRLERRHRDLREVQTKLLEAERITATRELVDLMDRAIGTPLHRLVDELEALGHLDARDPGDLGRMVDRARRMESGLDRTLETLRRTKLERTACPIVRLVEEFEGILRARLEGDGIDLRVAGDVSSGAVYGDPGLLGAALEHVAEHLARHAALGGRVEMEVGRCADRAALRIVLFADRLADRLADRRDGADGPTTAAGDPAATLDLELARGLFRTHGGDLTIRPGAPDRPGLEISLPVLP